MRGFVVLCLAGLFAGMQQIEGRIVEVHDGDTITLMDADQRQHKIRLDGIDAPESGQPFGRAAKQHLADLLADRMAVAECYKADRYEIGALRRAAVRGAGGSRCARGRLGAVSFVQRFGSALNAHVHFHCCVIDGVFAGGEDGEVHFAEAAALTPEDFATVQQQVRGRVLRWFSGADHLAPGDADDGGSAGSLASVRQRICLGQ